MGYTLTMDASHKVTKQGGHHRTFVKHIGRDLDRANGVEQKHSNKGIDASRTHLNRTMVSDGQGGWKKAQSTDEMLAAVEARLADVKPQVLKNGTVKSMRKDAVVIRPLILQIDPEWFKEHCPDWKETGDLGPEGDRLHDEVLKWAANEFGAQNLPFYSLHLDEWSPQIQLGFVPVTDDGRLAQGEFFKGRESLGRMHTEFRAHMRAAGHDVSKERVTKDRTIKQMGDAEFKQYRDNLDEAEASKRDQNVVTKNARRDRELAAQERAQAEADRRKVADELAEVPSIKRRAALDARSEAMSSVQDEAAALDAQMRSEAAQELQEARRRAQSSEVGLWLQKERPDVWEAYSASLEPSRPRKPRVLYKSKVKKREDRELLVTYLGTVTGKDGAKNPAVQIELNALDPEAREKTGLIASGKYWAKDRKTSTHAVISPEVFEQIRRAAGDNRVQVGKRTTYAVRGDLIDGWVRSEMSIGRGSAKPSAHRVTADWEQRQQESEERAQEREAERRKNDPDRGFTADVRPSTDHDRGLGE